MCLFCLLHGFPGKFATPVTKSRLEEALSRPNEPPASGGNAPASGIFETDAEIVDRDGEDVLGHDLEVASSEGRRT